MAINAPVILERPGPVSYAADAHISNYPNVRKMARFSNSHSAELWEREYSRNFPNRRGFRNEYERRIRENGIRGRHTEESEIIYGIIHKFGK
ncbi:hypothetical protein CDAR_582451 [Caerostris darwini]|uniref:Uncharacterized protein n=1 Tax=Caerostris darwini TaxID=1538125 RepID=A0AAV4RKU5_9ARAC|nr:hypothetical protein CDAR_582451 [Caerostris darwini]